MKKKLQTSEWLLTASFFLLLASLFLISRFHDHRKNGQLKALPISSENQVEVEITGEVARPGLFYAAKGARLGDVLKKSRPKRFADCKELDLDSPLETSMEIKVPLLKEVSIRVEGAVSEAIDLQLPIGTRVCDLKSKIELADDAELKWLKSRRMLKDGEVISVPKKF